MGWRHVQLKETLGKPCAVSPVVELVVVYCAGLWQDTWAKEACLWIVQCVEEAFHSDQCQSRKVWAPRQRLYDHYKLSSPGE